MKKHQNILSTADFRNQKRILRVIKAISVIEQNTSEMVSGLYAVFNAFRELNETGSPVPSNKKKQQEFRESWLDKQEVMQLMPVSERSLYSLRKDGSLPSYTFKGKIYFKLSDVESLMKRRGGEDEGRKAG